MSRALYLASFLASIASLAMATRGVDLSVATTLDDWSCLRDNNVTFAIVRVFRSLGQVDANSANSLVAATKAGLSSLDAYIFPCIPGSPYALSKNISCPSAKEQVDSSVHFLESNGVMVHREGDARAAAGAATVGRMWLDIEDEVPSKYFDPVMANNQAFVGDIVQELQRLRIPLGVYTTKTYWANIMNNDMNYGSYPLWYPRYDNVDSFDFFVPFSAWTAVTIKQTAGDAPLCGLSQVDTDYMP